MKRKAYTALLVFLVAVGFAAGIAIARLRGTQTDAVPVINDPPSDQPIAGWCCPETGTACVADARGAVLCLQGGGRVFHAEQKTCNDFCALTAP